VARRVSQPKLLANKRAEVFSRLREALERGEVSFPRNDGLLAELSALRYEFSPTGQIRIEKKDAAKKRLGRSPDLADAVAPGFPPSRRAGLDLLDATAHGDSRWQPDLPSIPLPTRQLAYESCCIVGREPARAQQNCWLGSVFFLFGEHLAQDPEHGCDGAGMKAAQLPNRPLSIHRSPVGGSTRRVGSGWLARLALKV
jgi:hypothetical protein